MPKSSSRSSRKPATSVGSSNDIARSETRAPHRRQDKGNLADGMSNLSICGGRTPRPNQTAIPSHLSSNDRSTIKTEHLKTLCRTHNSSCNAVVPNQRAPAPSAVMKASSTEPTSRSNPSAPESSSQPAKLGNVRKAIGEAGKNACRDARQPKIHKFDSQKIHQVASYTSPSSKPFLAGMALTGHCSLTAVARVML